MEIKELRELSNLAQIEIRECELSFFLATFVNLESMIVNADFAAEIEGVVPMDRILTNHLELTDLRNFHAYHQVHKLDRVQLRANAVLSEDGKFVVPRSENS